MILRYTLDSIFNLVFGCDSNTLKDPNNPFQYYAELSIKINQIKGALAFFTPNVMNKLRIRILDPEASKFLSKLFLDMMEKRKNENTKRNDFLQSLIELTERDQIQDEENNDSSQTNDLDKGD